MVANLSVPISMQKFIHRGQIEAATLLYDGEQRTYEVPDLGIVWLSPRAVQIISKLGLEAEFVLVAFEIDQPDRPLWIVNDVKVAVEA